MNNIEQQIDKIFDYCGQVNNDYFADLCSMIERKVSIMPSRERRKFLYDFKNTLENRNNITEGIADKLRAMTLGTLLATCIINPALAQVTIENIQTHHPVTSKYESGKKGYDCIVKDNYGGYSYGKDQISTERRNGNPSTFDYFMKYAKEKDSNIEYHLRKAGGWEAAHKGDKAFIDKWCQLTYRKDFQDVYDGFMRDREFIPVYQKMDKSGNKTLRQITTWASQNKAVQASVNSTIIQHGKNGAYKIISKVASKKIKTPEEFVKSLYDLRAAKFPKYKARYKSEYADVSKYLKSKSSAI